MAVEIVRNTIADPRSRILIERAAISGLTQRASGDWKVRIEESVQDPSILVSFSGRDALENRRFLQRDPEYIQSWLANVAILY